MEYGYQMLYPRQVILATSQSAGMRDIITLGWHCPLSFKPPLIGISVGKTRFSHSLIEKGREFVVSIPTEDMKDKVLLIGSKSGKDVDKFSEFKLTPLPATEVKPPLIKECPVNIECRVVAELDAGDHTLFAGEVVASHASSLKGKLLFDMGGRKLFGIKKKLRKRY
ncbi:flavin reductase family protein [Candidatus Micrarchaeota archaeon]|nr:flavin reductase family protein [Candidatus Micrarchaeota archaeon]